MDAAAEHDNHGNNGNDDNGSGSGGISRNTRSDRVIVLEDFAHPQHNWVPKNERSSILPRFGNVGMQSIFPCHLGRKYQGCGGFESQIHFGLQLFLLHRILGFTRRCIHSTSQSHKQCHCQNHNDDCDDCFHHSIHSRITASCGLW